MEKEEELVTLEQVHDLSSLPQGPEVLNDLGICRVLAGLLRNQLTNQQGLHELEHKTEVAVEGQECSGIFFPVVPDDLAVSPGAGWTIW